MPVLSPRIALCHIILHRCSLNVFVNNVQGVKQATVSQGHSYRVTDWPHRFDSQIQDHKWVEFVVASPLAQKAFPLSLKTESCSCQCYDQL